MEINAVPSERDAKREQSAHHIACESCIDRDEALPGIYGLGIAAQGCIAMCFWILPDKDEHEVGTADAIVSGGRGLDPVCDGQRRAVGHMEGGPVYMMGKKGPESLGCMARRPVFFHCTESAENLACPERSRMGEEGPGKFDTWRNFDIAGDRSERFELTGNGRRCFAPRCLAMVDP